MKKFVSIIVLLCCVAIITTVLYQLKQFEKTELTIAQNNQLNHSIHQNSDVYAWLKVDGTKIDYPIAQHEHDNRYYLTHDLEHQKNYYGAIFTENVNTKTFNDLVTIIYGHAIKDDTMFGSLDYFENKSIFDKYQNIVVTTKDRQYNYRIIAAYKANNDHLYHTFQLGHKEHVANYFSTIKQHAQKMGGHYRDVDFDVSKDKLLILSTCDAIDNTKRFVVHAIRVDR